MTLFKRIIYAPLSILYQFVYNLRAFRFIVYLKKQSAGLITPTYMNSPCKRKMKIQNDNFMSLYVFAFVISGLRRISFDISSHKKNKTKKYMLFLLKRKNTAHWVFVQLLSPYWVRPVFNKNKKVLLFLHCCRVTATYYKFVLNYMNSSWNCSEASLLSFVLSLTLSLSLKKTNVKLNIK